MVGVLQTVCSLLYARAPQMSSSDLAEDTIMQSVYVPVSQARKRHREVTGAIHLNRRWAWIQTHTVMLLRLFPSHRDGRRKRACALWPLTSPGRAPVWEGGPEKNWMMTRLELEGWALGTRKSMKEGLTGLSWACLHPFKGRLCQAASSQLV